jgi:hypothetical protein
MQGTLTTNQVVEIEILAEDIQCGQKKRCPQVCPGTRGDAALSTTRSRGS